MSPLISEASSCMFLRIWTWRERDLDILYIVEKEGERLWRIASLLLLIFPVIPVRVKKRCSFPVLIRLLRCAHSLFCSQFIISHSSRTHLLDATLPPSRSEAMESCSKVEIENFDSLLKEENLYLTTEAGEQGRLLVLILSLKDRKQRRPAVVFLHSTNKCKEWLRPLLEAYVSRGYVAIAINSRYNGECATTKTTY